MSQEQMEKKVAGYLRNSQALEDYWQRPITAEQLQAEMDRMAKHTKQPAVLRELFEALGNDPFVIAECLARPVLAERLVTNLYAHEQRIHGEVKVQPEYRRASADNRAPYNMAAQVPATGFPLSRIGRADALTKRGQPSAPPMHLHREPPTQRCGLGVR